MSQPSAQQHQMSMQRPPVRGYSDGTDDGSGVREMTPEESAADEANFQAQVAAHQAAGPSTDPVARAAWQAALLNRQPADQPAAPLSPYQRFAQDATIAGASDSTNAAALGHAHGGEISDDDALSISQKARTSAEARK